LIVKNLNIPGTDLCPSAICLGTVPFGSTLSEKYSFDLLDACLHLGGNFIDTANVYADWIADTKSASEKTIGKWLQTRRNRGKVIIATKGGHPKLYQMQVPRLTKKDIIHDLHESLHHLQTDYVDLYWLHRDDPSIPVENILMTLEEQVQSGKIRYYGCSNWTASRLKEARNASVYHNIKGFAANQPLWSLAVPNHDRLTDKTMVQMDDELKAFHSITGMAVIPYSSQANGFFSGRYQKNDKSFSSPSSSTVYQIYYNDGNFERLNRVKHVAQHLLKTTTQIALGYLLSQPYPVFPIVGSRTIEQLRDSYVAADIRLDPQTVRYLNLEISDYPY
jgi:aryl-alcohol dehydrogenase-like predicted oxidoreductase